VLGYRIPHEDVLRALTIVLINIFSIITLIFLLCLNYNGDFIKILFEVVSAVGTVGLSLGITADLDNIGRMLIIIAMFLGRMGPLTLGFALMKERNPVNIRYPQGKIMVG